MLNAEEAFKKAELFRTTIDETIVRSKVSDYLEQIAYSARIGAMERTFKVEIDNSPNISAIANRLKDLGFKVELDIGKRHMYGWITVSWEH